MTSRYGSPFALNVSQSSFSCAPGMPKTQPTPSLLERLDQRLGAGHAAEDPAGMAHLAGFTKWSRTGGGCGQDSAHRGRALQ